MVRGDSMRHLAQSLRCSGFILLAMALCGVGAQAQNQTALTAGEIVARMLAKNGERQTALQHYASERTYELHYSGTGGEHHAKMVVDVDYTAPGRKHFTVISESGSKVLCKEVLRKLVDGEEQTAAKSDWQRTMFSPETYNLELLGREQLDGISTWVLKVDPKVDSKIGYRGKVWISTDDFATVRVLGEPEKNPSWLLNRTSFDSRYMRRGEIWLPSRNISTSHVRIGGDARVTIDYGDYEVLSVTGSSVGNAVATAPAVKADLTSLVR